MANEAEKLRVSAAGERELVISRSFNAPRRMVFDAHTKPELLKRWLLGPPGWVLAVCDVDLKVGGRYRYVWRRESGSEKEMGMGGVYREIVRPERIVQTEKFDEAWYPGEAVGTLVLVEQNGKTLMTTTMLYESQEARDAVVKSGMESGLAPSYDRLDEVLSSLHAGENAP